MQILDDALHLDVEGDFEISDKWQQEIAKRCREIDAGEVELISADDVFWEAFEKLR